MRKPAWVLLFAVVLVIGGLIFVKVSQFKALASQPREVPPVNVTFANATKSNWDRVFETVGSLEAVDGIIVSAEKPGKITEIEFIPGSQVSAGQLLVQQDVSVEQAQLRGAQARADLALSKLKKVRQLIAEKSAPVSELEIADAQAVETLAQIEELKAVIKKKSITAPFSGRLGLSQISLGQDLQEGNAIVSLQRLQPIRVNFYVPQQQMSLIQIGLTVKVSLQESDTQLQGQITAIDATIDPRSRNMLVQAQLSNNDERLLPGMYVTVGVVLPDTVDVVAVPATAVHYAPFGNSVYVIEHGEEGEDRVRQQMVTTGVSRGDFIQVLSGLSGGETVVSTGVFKLFNGQRVMPDNSQTPAFDLNPNASDS